MEDTQQKRLGKIHSVRFGMGGYQDIEIGLWLVLSMGESSRVGASVSGGYAGKRSEGAQWTEEQRTNIYASMVHEVASILTKAKVDSVGALAGIPVEVTLEGMKLVSWRVLEEVL